MNGSFKVCWYCPTNLYIDKFQNDTEVLFAYSGDTQVGCFPLGWVNFAKKKKKNLSKFPISNNCGAHFSVGKKIYWVGNFGQWAGLIYWVGKLIYWVGTVNLLLPPCLILKLQTASHNQIFNHIVVNHGVYIQIEQISQFSLIKLFLCFKEIYWWSVQGAKFVLKKSKAILPWVTLNITGI